MTRGWSSDTRPAPGSGSWSRVQAGPGMVQVQEREEAGTGRRHLANWHDYCMRARHLFLHTKTTGPTGTGSAPPRTTDRQNTRTEPAENLLIPTKHQGQAGPDAPGMDGERLSPPPRANHLRLFASLEAVTTPRPAASATVSPTTTDAKSRQNRRKTLQCCKNATLNSTSAPLPLFSGIQKSNRAKSLRFSPEPHLHQPR